ncbi:PTS sugar transporter subunit IIA [Paenibacillus pasadenensis]|uniref:Mannitol-specific phosphotransferase enzyme IIA component n=1 Tax=Paenibacillus pasadenensis TaxID=217090 RepID=A0A2N5N4D7_9BACL|nr:MULTISPECIES: PTS sugar transporter subunit IIA [Paenibacillus]PLT45216.1 PTS system, mannitol-specific IIA component [Paenibacillus pasadenensis]QGG55604.1 PTS mannitol transporter subunit IIA [Paenibacillus sp. B01]
MLKSELIRLNVAVKDKWEAVRLAGQLLVDAGHADADYVEKMVEREQALSTYMGSGLAIPHGTNEAKALIRSTGLSVLQIPGGVDFGGDEPAVLVVGIAAQGGEHMDILTSVAMVCSEEESMERIRTARSAQEIIDIFESGMEE